MDFDELFALYGVKEKWESELSDRDIFAEEPLNINKTVATSISASFSPEWEKVGSETVKINDITFQSWVHIQNKETTVNEFDYPLHDDTPISTSALHEDSTIFEYPLQSNNFQKEELAKKDKIIEDREDEEASEDVSELSENNLFWESIAHQTGNTIKRPRIDVIASQSDETPLETLMWVQEDSSKENLTEDNTDEYNYDRFHRVRETQGKDFSSEFPAISKPFKWIKVFSEIKVFVVLFLTVFSTFFFFTNAKLVMITVSDIIGNGWENSVTLITWDEHNVADIVSQKEEKLAALEENFQNIQKYKREEQDLALNMQDFLNQQQEAHLLNFNTLPPTNRLIVPDLGINVPLIDIPSMGEEDFENGNFDDELMHWVVKYPTTATPGSQGNSLIFWHSSSEWWKHNEYWFIFRNLPTLQPGQKIQVIWNWQLTTYEMIERKVVKPKEVWEYYHQFVRDWEYYLTLMGCYPIWSSAERMMVVAKKISN